MKRWGIILVLVIGCGMAFAQVPADSVLVQQPQPTLNEAVHDTLPTLRPRRIINLDDTINSADLPVDTTIVNMWRPDPMRAVWMGLIIPGYGQIYNRAYWKLPIVYGGFMGCVYAITWNNRMYTDYKQAYRDILTDTDGTKTSYLDILPEGYTIEMMGGKANYTKVLKTRQDTYRRYRDYSIVATIAVYALSVIDAYVDAQLFDYDISTDLTMHIQPQIYTDPFNRKSAEVYLAIDF